MDQEFAKFERTVRDLVAVLTKLVPPIGTPERRLLTDLQAAIAKLEAARNTPRQ